MSQNLLTKLKKKLPFQYAKAINEESSQLSLRRVRAVFNGEVTDPEKVTEVVKAAEAVIKKHDALNRLLMKNTGPKKIK